MPDKKNWGGGPSRGRKPAQGTGKPYGHEGPVAEIKPEINKNRKEE